MLPHMASGGCLPCRMSLSSDPENQRFCGHCWSETDCGLQEIRKTFLDIKAPVAFQKLL